jgi:hypothetical protein
MKRVEIKPYMDFPKAVYVDGKLIPSQTLDGPWRVLGLTIFKAHVDERIMKPFCLDDIDKSLVLFKIFYTNKKKDSAGNWDGIRTVFIILKNR